MIITIFFICVLLRYVYRCETLLKAGLFNDKENILVYGSLMAVHKGYVMRLYIPYQLVHTQTHTHVHARTHVYTHRKHTPVHTYMETVNNWHKSLIVYQSSL